MSKKILVTGGTGFIGSHTVLDLLKSGYTPIIVDNFSNSEQHILDRIKDISGVDELIFVEKDCTDYSQMSQVFKDHHLSGVIHFAAFKAVGESFSKPLEYHYNNVNSLNVILKCMREYEVSNLVFSSSCTIYGNTTESPVSEVSKKFPATSPYGRTKVYCEQAVSDVYNEPNSKLSTIMLRYFNPVGAHPSGKLGELPLGAPNNLVPYITQTAIGKREELVIFGDQYDTPDGTCVRDYVHVCDISRAHVLALKHLENESKQLEAINLGSESGASVMEVVNTFEKASGVKVNYRVGPARKGDVSTVYAQVVKAKSLINWSPEFTLSEALEHAWQWEKYLTEI